MLDSVREKCQKQSEIGSKDQENPSSHTRAGGTWDLQERELGLRVISR